MKLKIRKETKLVDLKEFGSLAKDHDALSRWAVE